MNEKISIKLPAKMDHLEKMISFVMDRAALLKFNAKRISQINLVMEEVLVNIISYAYPVDREGVIELRYNNNGDNILLEIEDNGNPFNILSSPEPDIGLNVEERDIGGLGILLVKKMTNSLEYERKDDKNILTITFLKDIPETKK